jgi:TRAP-type C4-dicarboxylate transport system permease large subunit
MVGIIRYVVVALGKISIGQFAKEAWPFVIALIIALFLVTYLPDLAFWFPSLVMPAK